MNEQMKSETPYLTYGKGFEEEDRINGKGYIHNDILDLAEELKQAYPKDVYANIHRAFEIGFRCGVRSERQQ